jgi:hypothetical protein
MIKTNNKIYSISYSDLNRLETCSEIMLNENLKPSKSYTINFNDYSLSTSKEKTFFDSISEKDFLELLEIK